MTFDEARAQFPVLDRVAYLNAGSMGPLARATVEAIVARQERDLEQGRGGRPFLDEMLALRQRVRAGLARTIAVPAENVALTASTTEGCNIVVSGLRLRPEDEVVTTDTEHFGLIGPLHASGARVRVARVRELPPERALETILAEVGPRTRLLALSHVSWQSGNLLPVEELQEETGLPVLVDGAQSAGAIAVDAKRFDFYTVSGQKWLCGPDSTGALYVRDPEGLDVALPTYFSQDAYDEAGAFTPKSRRRPLRRRLDPDRLARRPRGGAGHGPQLGCSPRSGGGGPLLDDALRPFPGRHRARPGNAGLVRHAGATPPRRSPACFDQASSSASCRAPAGCGFPAAGGRATTTSSACSTRCSGTRSSFRPRQPIHGL